MTVESKSEHNLIADSRDDWKAVRELRRHENDLVNHRITWMVTFHSLLISAVAFAWGKDKPLVVGFTVAGLVVALSSWFSVRIAVKAARQLEEWWDQNGPKYATAPPLTYRRQGFIVRFLPWHFWPASTAAGWVVLGIYAVCSLP